MGPISQPEYYRVDSMTPEEKNQFLAWQTDNQEKISDFKKTLNYYCQSIVKMLREACLSYWNEIIMMTRHAFCEKRGGEKVKVCHSVDPFEASTCTSTYRFVFLKTQLHSLARLLR